MVESIATRASLLLRLRDRGDIEAWREYVITYKPKCEKWARRFGIREDDLDDVVQEVLVRVAKGASKFRYDSNHGRYRAWLRTVTHNVAVDMGQKITHRPLTNGKSDETDPMTMVADTGFGDSLLDLLLEGERESLFRQAEQQTRSESSELEWQAYHQSVYLGKEATEIAAALGIKVGNYYTCKSRFIARLTKNFKELDQ